jgi:hypothetical protein
MSERARPRSAADVLERGDIFFFYRPRIDETSPEDESDLERFFLILRPSGRSVYRLILLGRKHLPPTGNKGGERFWGLVDRIFREPEPLRRELKEKRYRTRKGEERIRPAARPAGEGVYAIARHGDHVHLAYALELPNRAGPVQKDLGIEDQASFILNVKNPDVMDRPDRPGLPRDLQDLFHGRKFLPADPAAFLDAEKTELLFIAVRRAVEKELGIEFHPQDETRRSAEMFRDLKVQRLQTPLEPLLHGEWA